MTGLRRYLGCNVSRPKRRTSRFLLDLQEAHQRTVIGLATNDPFYTSQSLGGHSLNFANTLGSLGATIDSNSDGEEDGEQTDGCVVVLEGMSPNNAGDSS